MQHRIPIIHARFFPAGENARALERRFCDHLLALRKARLVAGRLRPDDISRLNEAHDASLKCSSGAEGSAGDVPVALSIDERGRVARRVAALIARRESASGLSNLKHDDRERLNTLRSGVTLVMVTTEHRADEIAAALHDAYPWLAAATEIVWCEVVPINRTVC